MALYANTATAIVMRTTDGATIPNDPANRDRQDFNAWVAAGNTPDPFVPHVDTAQEAAIKQILANDATIFRALELLIDVLLAKSVIVATDFPPAVRTLYLARKAQRVAAGLP